MKKKMKKIGLVIVSIFILMVIGVELFYLFGVKKDYVGAKLPEATIKEYASKVIEKCSTASYRPSCYDKEVPKYMDNPYKLSMEDAFKVTAEVQNQDKTFTYCHVLGHELSAKEVDKDQSKWKDVLTRCPSGVCSNGCLHGGMQERFRSDSLTEDQLNRLKPDFASLCRKKDTWTPTGLEQGSCYHALGHLLMYATKADATKASRLCDELTKNDEGKWYTTLCYDGVFMQIYQPLEPEDFALVKNITPKKDGVDSFCSAYESNKRESCHTESWPLFFKEIMTPDGLYAFCQNKDIVNKQKCFNALFYVAAAQLQLNVEKITTFCDGTEKEVRGQCFASSASRLIEVDYRNADNALALCTEADRQGVGENCYRELATFATYNYHSGSPESKKLCNSLPDNIKGLCLTQN